MRARIKSIDFRTLKVPMTGRAELNMSRGHPNWCISEICIVSDDSGNSGFGETLPHYTWGRPDRERAGSLLDSNPFDHLWDDSLGSGVQMALWDLAGKLADAPCHRLLGRSVRDEIPIAWWCMDMPAKQWAAEAEQAVKSGYTAMKIKARPWFDLDAQLTAISAATPPNFKIDADFNNHLNEVGSAVGFLRSMEARHERMAIWETPIPQADVEGNRQLRARIGLPIAMHFGIPPYSTAVAEQVCDGFVVGGGTGSVVRSATLAAEANKPLWLQLVGTGITTAWAVQLGAVLSHARWPAVTCMNIYKNDLVAAALAVADGFIRVPDGPGLGIAPDLEAIENFEVPDGTTAEWPRRVYTVTWPGGRTVRYGGYQQYVDDFLMGNQPIFERGVELSMLDDDGSAEFDALSQRLEAAPLVGDA